MTLCVFFRWLWARCVEHRKMNQPIYKYDFSVCYTMRGKCSKRETSWNFCSLLFPTNKTKKRASKTQKRHWKSLSDILCHWKVFTDCGQQQQKKNSWKLIWNIVVCKQSDQLCDLGTGETHRQPHIHKEKETISLIIIIKRTKVTINSFPISYIWIVLWCRQQQQKHMGEFTHTPQTYRYIIYFLISFARSLSSPIVFWLSVALFYVAPDAEFLCVFFARSLHFRCAQAHTYEKFALAVNYRGVLKKGREKNKWITNTQYVRTTN